MDVWFSECTKKGYMPKPWYLNTLYWQNFKIFRQKAARFTAATPASFFSNMTPDPFTRLKQSEQSHAGKKQQVCCDEKWLW